MPMNRHLSLLEARVDRLQILMRSRSLPELAYSCLQNIVAEGDGWSDWQDFLDHGRYAVIERNWHEKTLRALNRQGISELTLEDLRRLDLLNQSRPSPSIEPTRESRA